MRLLLTICCAASLLGAAEGPAAADPFAAYRQSIESQLAGILDRQPAAIERNAASVESKPDESKPDERKPNESKEADIKVFARRFWGGREAELATALDRLQRLRPTLESILDSEGVPKQLAAVVLIESGAQPQAISPRQARGLWQFIPETARQYGLTVAAGTDERVHVEYATRAAARYLRDLYNHFGDWPLALAAYNAGPGSVEGALQKGRVSTFWQLSSAGLLPTETRGYVPAVLAAMRLLGSTQPATPANHWVYASVGVVH